MSWPTQYAPSGMGLNSHQMSRATARVKSVRNMPTVRWTVLPLRLGSVSDSRCWLGSIVIPLGRRRPCQSRPPGRGLGTAPGDGANGYGSPSCGLTEAGVHGPRAASLELGCSARLGQPEYGRRPSMWGLYLGGNRNRAPLRAAGRRVPVVRGTAHLPLRRCSGRRHGFFW